MRPQLLPPNMLHHFYAGGARLSSLRGVRIDDDHTPEEWLGAVNTTFAAHDDRGLSRLDDGTLVRDAVAADPVALARPGARRALRRGPCSADQAARRRPAAAGPLPSWSRVRARGARAGPRQDRGLDRPRGGAWCVRLRRLQARGRARDRARVDAHAGQRGDARRDATSCRSPPGNAIFVPAGTPHAIGAGILMVELQEPADLSVTLEWTGFELGEDDGHLGLGWSRVLTALDRTGWDEPRLATVLGAPATDTLLPADADPYFRAEWVAGRRDARGGLRGARRHRRGGGAGRRRRRARLRAAAAPSWPRTPPATLVLKGEVEGLWCRPPDPASREGKW